VITPSHLILLSSLAHRKLPSLWWGKAKKKIKKGKQKKKRRKEKEKKRKKGER